MSISTAQNPAETPEIESHLLERERQAALSHEISLSLIQSRTLPEMLQRCAEAIVSYIGVAFARIWVLNEEVHLLELQASAGMYTNRDDRYSRIPVGTFKIGKIAETQKSEWTNTVGEDPYFSEPEWARQAGMVAFAGYPLVVEGHLVGVMAMFGRQPLTEVTIEGLTSIGNSLALGIMRKQADEQLQEKTQELETLRRTGELLIAELDLQKLVQIVTDEATALCGAEFGSFFYNVLDERGESYVLYTLSGVPREAFSRFPMPRNTHIFSPTFSGTGVVRSDDITQDPRYGKNPPYNGMPHGHLPVRSYLAVPVIARSGEVIGGLFFGHSQTGVFTNRKEKTLVALAAQAALAMDNARLFEAAQREIAERKETEAALQTSQEELNLAIDGAQLGTFYRDAISNKIIWNDTCKEQFSIPADADINFDLLYTFIHPDDREAVRQEIERCTREHERYNLEFRVLTSNGQVRWINGIGKGYYRESGEPYRFNGITIDITEKKEREQALNLLVEINDATREMQAPNEILLTVARMLGEHLEVSRCAYAPVEEDGDHFNIYGDYTNGCHSIVGRYPLTAFGARAFGELSRGETYVVNDIDREAPPGEDISVYRQTEIQAVICTSLIKGGKMVGLMAVHQTQPRQWTTAEIQLVEMIAERSWAIIERALADKLLKERAEEVEALNYRLRRSMRETHHRVKNNLQIVAAMIDMQALEHSQEQQIPLEEFLQLKTHIQTLSIVHDLLTQGIKEEEDAQRVSVKAVMDRLLPMLQQTYRNQEVRYQIEDAIITSKQCVALCIVITELVSNSLKHGRNGADVRLTIQESRGTLEVLDYGPGFPEGFDVSIAANTGLELVESLAHADLKGTVRYENQPSGGGHVVVTFSLPPAEE